MLLNLLFTAIVEGIDKIGLGRETERDGHMLWKAEVKFFIIIYRQVEFVTEHLRNLAFSVSSLVCDRIPLPSSFSLFFSHLLRHFQ